MNYVMITGASAGIGEEFARALAAEKQNLILVARREERLSALARELSGAHGITVEVLAADLATADGTDQIAKAVEASGWTLKGLVNNAGFGDRGAFTELSLERQLNMIQVNVTSLVALTWKLMGNLKASQEGFIINVASTAAFQGGPNMAVYYASKAFVLSFTEALHEELRDTNIKVSTLCPGPTASEFATEANIAETKLFKAGAMTTQAVVRASLAKRRKAIVIPGLTNKLTVWFGKLSPRLMTRRLAGWLQA
ncbi:SDR family NAD(P)-dependent oxidoreductase [Marinobacter nitratireducens]|nr:SDR family oxidoreductase [Marinobacter nitratireducens]